MKPPEEEVRRLVAEWIGKADLDFDTAVRLAGEERLGTSSPSTRSRRRRSI
jgi:hypothetical protein